VCIYPRHGHEVCQAYQVVTFVEWECKASFVAMIDLSICEDDVFAVAYSDWSMIVEDLAECNVVDSKCSSIPDSWTPCLQMVYAAPCLLPIYNAILYSPLRFLSRKYC